MPLPDEGIKTSALPVATTADAIDITGVQGGVTKKLPSGLLATQVELDAHDVAAGAHTGTLARLADLEVFHVSEYASIQAAIDAALAAGGGVVAGKRGNLYDLAVGLSITAGTVPEGYTNRGVYLRDLMLRNTADITLIDFNGHPHGGLFNVILLPGANTTVPAVRQRNSSGRFSWANVFFKSSGGVFTFAKALENEGAFIGEYDRLTVEVNSVAPTGTSCHFRDGSGVGTYPPNAITLRDPDISGGDQGVLVEDSDGGFLIVGGTVESNNYVAKGAVKFLNCERPKIDGTYLETGAGGFPVIIEGSAVCVLDSVHLDRPVKIRTSGSTTLRAIRGLTLDIDNASADTVVVGGGLSATGLDAELGTRTQLVAVSVPGVGNVNRYRSLGAEIQPPETATLPAPIRIAAAEMIAVSGAPTLSNLGGSGSRPPAWLLDAAADEYLSAPFAVPAGWASVQVTVVWANNGVGAGDVVFQLQHQSSTGDGFDWNAGPTALGAVTDTAGAQRIEQRTDLGTFTVVAKRFVNLRLLRLATNVADTLANDAGVLGLLITRAS